MATIGFVDQDYWGDRLEVSTEWILAQYADDSSMAAWVDELSPCCRTILMERFGIPPESSVQEVRHAILGRRDELVPFVLVDSVATSKRIHAIVEVARARLADDELAQARLQDDHLDRRALMWLLYLRDPANLELVFHLDRAQRKGFARMVLDPAPAFHPAGIEAFFACEQVQRIVDAYEQEQRTLRTSHCAEILHDGGIYKVFIKRDARPSFASRGARNAFGFEREWIILDFEPGLRRVHICSLTPDVPLVLANRIASAYFGQPVAYQNESSTTDSAQIAAFLHSLVDDPDTLPLVELAAKNSGLVGSPQIRLSDPDNTSLAPALRHFAAGFTNPLTRIEDIESLKVYAFNKRIKVIFEPVDVQPARYVVRYADQRLNGAQRRAFEQRMESEYGITVLSIEKKHAR